MGSSTACCAISGTQFKNEAALISTSGVEQENVVSAEQHPESEEMEEKQRKMKIRSTETYLVKDSEHDSRRSKNKQFQAIRVLRF